VANARAGSVAGKMHQWMLKLVNQRIIRKRTSAHLRISPHKMLVNYKGKSSNSTMEEDGRHHLNQVTKVNVTSNKTSSTSKMTAEKS
jgi:hypothetical protein